MKISHVSLFWLLMDSMSGGKITKKKINSHSLCSLLLAAVQEKKNYKEKKSLSRERGVLPVIFGQEKDKTVHR
ncbi:MAG: hypothetical protein ACYC9M_03070 [Desulfobulbaceae bacterium]